MYAIRSYYASPIDMGRVFGAHEFDAIVNFAAETHVDRSLMDASIFIQTNMFGVQNLLDQCRKRGVRRFQQLSSPHRDCSAESGNPPKTSLQRQVSSYNFV